MYDSLLCLNGDPWGGCGLPATLGPPAVPASLADGGRGKAWKEARLDGVTGDLKDNYLIRSIRESSTENILKDMFHSFIMQLIKKYSFLKDIYLNNFCLY